MPRIIYRNSIQHSCFSPELYFPKPVSGCELKKIGEQQWQLIKCRCRKAISRSEAKEKVELGEALWLMDYSGSEPTPTWDIVLFGRVSKVPKAAVMDKAFIQRGAEASDGWAGAAFVEKWAEKKEIDEKWKYAIHDTIIESRLPLFSCGAELLEIKKLSDKLGTISGIEAKWIVKDLVHKVDSCKYNSFVPGPEGPVLSMIGLDERTHK